MRHRFSTHVQPVDDKVGRFVESSGGTRAIRKILIANNGIAAVKKIRSVRKWSYETFGNEKTILFTVMASADDLKANAEYIKMADQYIEVPGGSNNNNYANVDLIVDLAERTGVDVGICGVLICVQAVWAGWGHASENPQLPEALDRIGVAFIGPTGRAMRMLGDKISSTIVAESANVNTISWSGSGITVDTKSTPITITEEAYRKACVLNWMEGAEMAAKIGLPVMIKASEGGGGKGIRKVLHMDEFQSLFEQVSMETPGSPIFIMKLAGSARHLEVQILADSYGNTISLFGRDCSVQRRHQKIIEEAPVTIAPPSTFREMERAAVRLARLVGYVNAGTVEFLYVPSENRFYFLELNPRLQVKNLHILISFRFFRLTISFYLFLDPRGG